MRLMKKLVCAALLLCAMQPVTAGTVTLGFEAEVDRVSGIPFDSGVNFNVGDVISGQFTFTPDEGKGGSHYEAVQPYDFRLMINGIAVASPVYETEVFDNTPILDFPPASVIDWIAIGAGGLGPAGSTMLPNIDASASSLRMSLYGQSDLLNEAGLPYTADEWNQFGLWRQLSVSFRDGGGNVEGFQATVRAFTIVPEPCMHIYAIYLLGAFAMSYTNRLMQQKSFN